MPVSVWLIVLITDTHWSGVSTSSSETLFSGSGTKSELSFHCYGRICLSLLCYLLGHPGSFLNTFPDTPQSLLFGCLEWIWAAFLLSRCKKKCSVKFLQHLCLPCSIPGLIPCPCFCPLITSLRESSFGLSRVSQLRDLKNSIVSIGPSCDYFRPLQTIYLIIRS